MHVCVRASMYSVLCMCVVHVCMVCVCVHACVHTCVCVCMHGVLCVCMHALQHIQCVPTQQGVRPLLEAGSRCGSTSTANATENHT